MKRRTFLQSAGAPAGPGGATGKERRPEDRMRRRSSRRSESGCGGTLARHADADNRVSVIYLTRGEAGRRGKSHAGAADIRSAECEAACKTLGAKPIFAGQVDGATELNKARVDIMRESRRSREKEKGRAVRP